MQFHRPLALAVLIALAPAASALDLSALGALAAEESLPQGRLSLAVAPWRAGQALPVRQAEGLVTRRAFILPAADQDTLSLMRDLRARLVSEGLEPVFDCESHSCGGFDFRFEIKTLPEPFLHVDLGDFRYLSAFALDGRAAELLISRAPGKLFVQLTEVAPANAPAPSAPQAKADTPAPDAESQPLSPPQNAAPTDADALIAQGHLVLEDLNFASGAADLAAGDYPSLTALGAWLLAHPDRAVVLVGHTDASGGLEANIALSKRRAASVRRWILDHFDIAPARIMAEGAGFLAPRGPNETPAQRAFNRRVEAILPPAP